MKPAYARRRKPDRSRPRAQAKHDGGRLDQWPPRLSWGCGNSSRLAWTSFPDAAPTLRRLRDLGLRVGVITNGNHEHQSMKIARLGLEPLPDVFFSSEQMGHAKPDKSAFAWTVRASQGSWPSTGDATETSHGALKKV
ncbi:HAD family hydrolase [Arthrobacter sp. A2-55]|uniref:HAD family hydrolase n=1 Tax=Arthrobacter sp. A2-55 TaxID=2897337 RepID=UPI0039772C8D